MSCTELQDEESLNRLLNHVNTITGLDFKHYKRPTLARRIMRRMGVNKCDTQQQYIELLTNKPQEVNILSREFLIGVTKFFRDSHVWEAMENQILPELIRTKIEAKEPLKVWSVGCSTGEEVYTLAMLISEELKRQNRQLDVKIFATDIMRDFLNVAGKGIYPESIVADVSPHRLQEFFSLQGDEYQVRESLRRMVIFSQHNILKDPPFNKMDLVICRNLLIYIEPQMQQHVINSLHYALNLNGIMVLGTSETVGEHRIFMQEIHKRGKIYRNVQRARHLDHRAWKNTEFNIVKPYNDRVVKQNSTEHQMSREMNRALIEELGMLSVYIDQQFSVLHALGDTSRYLKLPDEGFSTNLLKMLPEKASTVLGVALRRVVREEKQILCKAVSFDYGETSRTIDILMRPFSLEGTSGNACILILFIPQASHAVNINTGIVQAVSEQTQSAPLYGRIDELETELQETQNSLQSTVEEMETSNEELQAMNEELLAANEELQSTNEELQSVNEELHTVNAEYQSKLEEVSTLNSEMDNLLESTRIGTLFLDREMNIRKFTPALREQFNLRSNDVGRPLSHFTSQFDESVNREIMEHARFVLEHDVIHQQEVLTKPGNKWYLERITPYYNHSGIIDGVVISFIDINTLKQTEAELEKSQNRYRMLYDHSPDMLLTIDWRDRTILYCNQTLVEKLGYERKEELIGLSAFELYHPDHLAEIESFFQEYKTAGRINNKELVVRSKQGDKLIVMVNASTQRDDKGKIINSNSVWRDITELKKTEEALRNSEERLRMVVEATSVTVTLINLEGAVLYVNQGTADINPGEVASLGSDIWSWPNAVEQAQTHLPDVIASRQPVKYESQLADADQLEHFFYHVMSPVFSEGDVIGASIVSIDVTEQKQLTLEVQKQRDELERRNEDLKQFAYITSHDLQEPLRTVSSFTELLAEDYKDKIDRAGQDFIEFILDATEHMSRLISALLDYSRLGNSGEITDVDLQALLRSVQNDLASTIVKSKADIQVDAMPTLSGYETEFRILFQNLLSNALKFHNKDRPLKIRISAERQKRQWQFAVQDNGIGIAPEQQKRIFAIFQRLHTQNEYEGTGIGLAYCKKIVELHGGRIWVESQFGVGSTFYFTIVDDVLDSARLAGIDDR